MNLPVKGEIFAGKFEIISDQYSGGGQGVGCIAKNSETRHKVFIKIYHKLKPSSIAEQKRFYTLVKNRLDQIGETRVCLPVSTNSSESYDPHINEYDGMVYAVFPFISGAPLKDRIDVIKDRFVLRRLILSMANICAKLESLGIAHLDLKPGNFMLDADANFKNINLNLIDLDYARIRLDLADPDDFYEGLQGLGGQPGYRSPEIYYSEEDKISSKSDVFSFALMLAELLCDASLFRTMNPEENLLKGMQVAFPKNCDLHPFLQSILRKCLARNYNDRPSMKELNFYLLRYGGTLFAQKKCGICIKGKGLSEPYYYWDEGNTKIHLISGEGLKPMIGMLPKEPCLKLRVDEEKGVYSVTPLLEEYKLTRGNKALKTNREYFLEIPDPSDVGNYYTSYALNGVPLRIYLQEY